MPIPTTREFVVDISGRLPTILLEVNPSNGSLIKTYVYCSGQILAQHTGDYSATRYFYLHDRLGSVRQVIDTDGDAVNHYTYKPLGELAAADATVDNPFMFTGREWDAETGNYYYRARYYSPQLGRFMSPDPIGYADGMNMFAYVGNNPPNFVDPWGLCRGIQDISEQDLLKTGRQFYIDFLRGQPKKPHYDLDKWKNRYDTKYHNMLNHRFRFRGKIYTGEQINYIGVGMAMRHFRMGDHSPFTFPILNNLQYLHLADLDEIRFAYYGYHYLYPKITPYPPPW